MDETKTKKCLPQDKILIVEDDKTLRDSYCRILQQAGIQACPAENYDQAIALIDDAIKLALLDVHLPGKSGLDILDYIHKAYPDCPVIMISGDTDKECTLAALRQGAVEYLEKPMRADKLVQAIRYWIDFHSIKQGNPRLKDFQAMHKLLQESELQTRLANERLNFLLASTAAVIYASEASGDCKLTFISDNIKRMSGHEADKIIPDPGFRLSRIHPDDLGIVRTGWARGRERGHAQIEYRFQHEDGSYFWICDEMKLEQNGDGQPEFLGSWVDISRHKQTEDEIKQVAYRDALTKLPNRTLFYDRLTQAIAQSHRNKTTMAVFFMDLDYFKPVNDELGHVWGDQALIEVGKRLQQCIRETDTVARIGGDEFSIILVDIASEAAACKVAEKIIAGVSAPMLLNDTQYNLGISIGICLEAQNHSNAETLMRIADDAMYQAKASGRNRYCVYQASGSQLPEKLNNLLQVEKSLRQALSNHELLIYYQPKVDLEDGRIIGTHALLRWNCPGSGMLLPDMFLSLAIKTGLIVPIGEWVLRQACRQNRAWQLQGLPIVPVSVNIAAEQLSRPGFAKLVCDILDETGLAANMLQLEISESDFMQRSANSLQALQALSDLGVTITLDNFGTGFFSLQSLQSLPIHELKMNRSLVKYIGQSGDSSKIANAIIALGHILDHQVVAEGVETKRQLQFLRQHNSDGMLGYLSSPPVSVPEFAAQLKKQTLNLGDQVGDNNPSKD